MRPVVLRNILSGEREGFPKTSTDMDGFMFDILSWHPLFCERVHMVTRLGCDEAGPAGGAVHVTIQRHQQQYARSTGNVLVCLRTAGYD